MANRLLRLTVVLAVVGLLLAGAGLQASMAQPNNDEQAFFCRDTRYDYNQDGIFNKADLHQFFVVAERDGCLYNEVGGNDCGEYDLDGSKVVNDDDMAVAHSFFMSCHRTADDNPR
jgi:hypothetical protein